MKNRYDFLELIDIQILEQYMDIITSSDMPKYWSDGERNNLAIAKNKLLKIFRSIKREK